MEPKAGETVYVAGFGSQNSGMDCWTGMIIRIEFSSSDFFLQFISINRAWTFSTEKYGPNPYSLCKEEFVFDGLDYAGECVLEGTIDCSQIIN